MKSGFTSLLILLITLTLTLSAQNYDILFSVEGPLDGSPDPTPYGFDENHIYLYNHGGIGNHGVVIGGHHQDLLLGLDTPDYPVGLDAFDVIGIQEIETEFAIDACYWSSEIGFNAYVSTKPEWITDGDLIAKGGLYYIQNQTLRWPFKFVEIPDSLNIGLDALDVVNVDPLLYLLLAEGTFEDRALGSFITGDPEDYIPEFFEFEILGLQEIWIFWSFETQNDAYTLQSGHMVYNPYDESLLPVGTLISADDLLLTVISFQGPQKGYLIRTGRDGLPVTSPQIESLFEGTTEKGLSPIGLDAVALPNVSGNNLGDSSLPDPFSTVFQYGSQEEVGPVSDISIDEKIIYSTSSDGTGYSHGDVLALKVNDGLANDIADIIVFDQASTTLLTNSAITGQAFNIGLDGIDVILTGSLTRINDWHLY